MQRAFSLVELAIVLVILGLLTGGILAGQSLIKASQLRSIGTDYTRYTGAISAFRDKYSALPGDMNNATSYWGVDAGGCPGTFSTSPTPGKPTCDGDGNNQIRQDAASANEAYRAWQHLANAGLVEGIFTGVPASGPYIASAPSTTTPNVPGSRIEGASWQPFFLGTVLFSDSGYFDGEHGNILVFGGGSNGRQPVLNSNDTWNVDTKLDDGKPGTGKITTRKDATQANSATGCSDVNNTVASSIATSSNYLLSNTAIVCTLHFKTGF